MGFVIMEFVILEFIIIQFVILGFVIIRFIISGFVIFRFVILRFHEFRWVSGTTAPVSPVQRLIPVSRNRRGPVPVVLRLPHGRLPVTCVLRRLPSGTDRLAPRIPTPTGIETANGLRLRIRGRKYSWRNIRRYNARRKWNATD